jgi:hypothetical protein
MNWEQVRKHYPGQWLVIEALDAHSEDNMRHVERMAVVSACTDGSQALQIYKEMHHQHPEREFYFVHTSRADLNIEERHWVGIRG